MFTYGYELVKHLLAILLSYDHVKELLYCKMYKNAKIKV